MMVGGTGTFYPDLGNFFAQLGVPRRLGSANTYRNTLDV